jgi:transposase
MYLGFSCHPAFMATGPKCSDDAQRYILQIMKNARPVDESGEIVDVSEQYDGETEWSIGSVFDDGNLESFGEVDEEEYDEAVEAFKNLDEIYDTLKITNSGGNSYSKLEGLKAFSDRYDAEIPTESRSTRNNWVHDYRDAGLLNLEISKEDTSPLEEGDVTELGHRFIRSTDQLEEELSGLDMDAGEFYGKLFSQGYGEREAYTGKKVKGFFLYGSGLSHTEIADELEIPESTVRGLATDLKLEGLLTENYMFTSTGRDVAQHVLEQVDLAEPWEFEGLFTSEGSLDI